MAPPQHPDSATTIAQVAIPSPLRKLFDYVIPESLQTQATVGARVQVPFGRRRVVGMIVGICGESEVPAAKLKPLSKLIDEAPLLHDSLFDTLLWAASYYQHPVGEVLHAALPTKLRRGEPAQLQETYYRLSANTNLEDVTASLKHAPRQLALLQLIANGEALSASHIKEQGFDQSLIKKLMEQELISAESRTHSRDEHSQSDITVQAHDLQLNASQQSAISSIREATGFNCFLLHGVTGSGKTEVYMRAMETHLQAGKQCLLLVPEIGLTPQTVARFQRRFACPIVSLHSGLTDAERLAAWRDANDGQARIIIGTRSAVFTPMARPGLIIIDEEHDASFKQQDGFRYSARDVAIKRAQAEAITIILGSATPSLESLNNANNDKYRLLQLPERAGGASQSPMDVLDINQVTLEQGFSEQLLLKIEQHLTAGNQVLIFINRRGYAPMLQCNACAWVCECANCFAQLTVHAQPPNLRCHHCESVLPLPTHCPNCQSAELYTLGAGTQKIEQFLGKRFEQTPIIRIDRDSTRSKRRLHELLDTINEGKPSILLGTQMLAKGHHFPAVTLVAILDADMGLFSADFRGQELMAQTIVQVAGRAGRADKPGEVVIQSRHASHPALNNLISMDYADYAQQILAERRSGQMPPFAHLALIHVESPQRASAERLALSIAGIAARLSPPQIDAIGPIPAPMEKRAGRYRMQVLFKSGNRSALQGFLQQLCVEIDGLKIPAKARWSLDVDPMDLI